MYNVPTLLFYCTVALQMAPFCFLQRPVDTVRLAGDNNTPFKVADFLDIARISTTA